MTLMMTVCGECGHEATAETPHCPTCGAADPWEEQPRYTFDPDDLPFVFPFNVSSYKWEPWEEFCAAYFGAGELKGSDVAGLPDEFPRLKYLDVNLWFRITEAYDIEGPYLTEAAARAGGDP